MVPYCRAYFRHRLSVAGSDKKICLALFSEMLLIFSVLYLYFLSEFINNLGAFVFLVHGGFAYAKASVEVRKGCISLQ